MAPSNSTELASKTVNFLRYDWNVIANKLISFVISYLNSFVKKNYKEWNLPKGYKAEDVAYQAIADVLDGTRNWNADKEPDLLNYLKFSVCRSIISNLLSSAHNKAIIKTDEDNFLLLKN